MTNKSLLDKLDNEEEKGEPEKEVLEKAETETEEKTEETVIETEYEKEANKESITTEIVQSTEKPTINRDLLDIEQERPLTLQERKEKIKQTMELINYTAKNALDRDDFWTPKRSNKKALTRSGCNKLATVFRISIETLRIWVEKELSIKGEEDIVAYAKVKATRPDGSSVITMANKALSDYASNKPGAAHPREWVDMQTLKGTAETRAANRAIQNAIGFVPDGYSVVTKEELVDDEVSVDDSDVIG